MKKFVFLILHYYTKDETIKCVESIESKCTNDFEIVIVDNASSNKSGFELFEKYKNNSKIHVILNEKNLGFANGNNVGFEYIFKSIEFDFIIMCNNDTELINNNFCSLIENEFEYSKFAVLGPKIVLPNNLDFKYPEQIESINELKRKIKMYQVALIKSNLPFYNSFYCLKRNILKNKEVKVDTNKNIENDYFKRKENVLLHGCFLIFSKEYTNVYEGLNPKTFLYYEEQLLFLRIKNKGLLSVYNPSIEIFHNERVSTTASNKTNKKREHFRRKNLLKSAKILLSELKNTN